MRGATAIAVLLAAGGLALGTAPALADQDTMTRGEALDRLPYWPGYWVSEGAANTPISGIALRTGPDAPIFDSVGIWTNSAPWNDEGRRRVAAAMGTQGGRKGQGWGYPLMMNAATPIQFLITPEEVLITNAYNETRHIYTDGRDHPPAEDLWPAVTGNSIGHWEGEALVVDTIMVTNPNEFFQGGPPLSEEARYVERIWLDGDKLRIEFTIVDPVTLSRPWVVNLSWVRDEGFDRMIQVDWNNDRTGTDGDTNTIEPSTLEEQGQ